MPDSDDALAQESGGPPIPQYSLSKILLVWAAAALPMGILGWVVAPVLQGKVPVEPGFMRLAVLTIGLIWQFALVAILLYREAGTLGFAAIKERLWLNAPRSPKTGATRARLWFWLLPVIALTAALELALTGPIDRAWVALVPFVAEPPGFSLGALLATPEARAHLVGAWDFWGLFMLSALFNTVIGEELLFRGLLLPRMSRAFGRGDWLANGVLFGLYHLHQPWGMLNSAIEGALCLALPSRYFRSAWFGIAAHSGQSIYFAILITALVI